MHLRMEQAALGHSTGEPGVAVGRLGVVCAPAQVCPGSCVSQFGGALLRRCLGLALSRPSSTCPSSTHSLPVQRDVPAQLCPVGCCSGSVLHRFGDVSVWRYPGSQSSCFVMSGSGRSRFGDVSLRDVPVRSLPSPFPRHTVATSRPPVTPTGTGTPRDPIPTAAPEAGAVPGSAPGRGVPTQSSSGVEEPR